MWLLFLSYPSFVHRRPYFFLCQPSPFFCQPLPRAVYSSWLCSQYLWRSLKQLVVLVVRKRGLSRFLILGVTFRACLALRFEGRQSATAVGAFVPRRNGYCDGPLPWPMLCLC